VRKTLDMLYGCLIADLPTAKGEFPLPSSVLHAAAVSKLDNVLILREAGAATDVEYFSLSDLRSKFKFRVDQNANSSNDLAAQLSRALPNPASSPLGDRKAVATELEGRGEFEMAFDVLSPMREEYKTMFISDIAERGALEQKLDELKRVVDQRACFRADEAAVYGFEFKSDGVSEDFDRLFRRALAETGFAAFLMKYANKPSRLSLHYDSGADTGYLRLEIRFLPKWYASSIAQYPPRVANLRVVTFRPYFGLMRELTRLRGEFARRLPAGPRESVSRLDMVLVLTKPCSQSLEFAVSVGSIDQVLDPYYLRLKLDGMDEAGLEPASRKVYEDTGMFPLGPAKVLSGESTIYGNLFKFLEIRE
jgi:hypothetical protein